MAFIQVNIFIKSFKMKLLKGQFKNYFNYNKTKKT